MWPKYIFTVINSKQLEMEFLNKSKRKTKLVWIIRKKYFIRHFDLKQNQTQIVTYKYVHTYTVQYTRVFHNEMHVDL